MKKYKVEYKGGQSRYSQEGVDYMQVVVEVEDDDIELYAELENETYNENTKELEDECSTYDELKKSILEQAAKYGLTERDFCFWFD